MSRRASGTGLARVSRILVEAMAKHLPPSAAELRLVDVNGFCGETLLRLRPDLAITATTLSELPSLPRCAFDAVVGFDVALDEPFLRDTLALLRPGGRLITIDSSSDPDEQPLKALEAAGYVRILVETGAECPLPVGTLARGERVHETEDTLERVRVSVGGEQADTALANYKGRFLHLLIQQTPNLPVWKLEPGQSVEWRAAALQNASGPALLAFSSLPAAVAFMQEAVLSGLVQGISKIAKFRRATALGWTHPVLLNPSLETAIQGAVAFIDIDPGSAEQPDE